MTGSFLAASVAVVRRDDLLLVQRNRPPSEGLWTLPGGRLEPGETPEQCAIREVREELGLAVYALRPLLVLRHGPIPEVGIHEETFTRVELHDHGDKTRMTLSDGPYTEARYAEAGWLQSFEKLAATVE